MDENILNCQDAPDRSSVGRRLILGLHHKCVDLGSTSAYEDHIGLLARLRHDLNVVTVSSKRVGNTIERTHQEIHVGSETRCRPILECGEGADQYWFAAELSEAAFVR